MRRLSRPGSGPSQQAEAAGFSLLELLVTLVVMAVVVLGILALFDVSNRLSRTQVNIAEMQTAQRIAQNEVVKMVRMAGIGGLPEGIPPASAGASNDGVFPKGLALAMLNNVAASTTISQTGAAVLPGTDIVVLRGVFSTGVYYLDPEVPVALDGTGSLQVTISSGLVEPNISQDLDPLREALQTPGRPEAFVAYDRFNPEAYVVMQYTGGSLGAAGDPTVTLNLSLGPGANRADKYGRLVRGTSLKQGVGCSPQAEGSSGQTCFGSWTLPDGSTVRLPSAISAIGLLEEYRIFVREEHEIPGDASSRLAPVLARARFYPSTDDTPASGYVYPDDSVLDLADNVIDFQVALGVDVDANGLIVDDGLGADEVLYNSAADDDSLTNIAASQWAAPGAQTRFVRLSTVVQADQLDQSFPGAIFDRVEDHDYSMPPSVFNTNPYIKLRKRVLQTTVRLRNLP